MDFCFAESLQLLFVPAGEQRKGWGVQKNRRAVVAQKIIAEGGVMDAAGMSK